MKSKMLIVSLCSVALCYAHFQIPKVNSVFLKRPLNLARNLEPQGQDPHPPHPKSF